MAQADPNARFYANQPPEEARKNGGVGDGVDHIREALIPEIIKQFSQPQPQAPQYQPTPITASQGFGLARNPHLAAQMMQYQQAPAQARYAQQQTAFEAAMGQRKEALGLGTALAGQASREDIARSALEARQRDEEMKNMLRALGLQIQANKAEKTSTPQGTTVYDKAGNAFNYSPERGAQPIVLPGGTQAGKEPSEQSKSKIEQIDEVRGLIDTLERQYKAAAGTPAVVDKTGKVIQEAIPGEHGKVARGIEGAAASWLPQAITDPFSVMADANDFEGTRQLIGSKIRGIADANNLRNIQEIQRLLKNVTTFGAGDRRAAISFQRMRELTDSTKEIVQRTRPEVAGISAPATAPSNLNALAQKAARGEKLTPQERQELDAGLTAAGH